MKVHQIENWVLNVVGRVESGQPVEDSRIELKSTWISPEKAARRLAGHANAARGAQILWLIGIDEEEGVIGAKYEELSGWYEKVKAQFDGLAPRMMEYNIPIRDEIVVALLFDTDRIPFVVKNPVHGHPGGGPVALEVPWREDTSTKSATRADLLRLLSPLQLLPSFEILKGSLSGSLKPNSEHPSELRWNLQLTLYATTSSEERVVIPFHKCKCEFRVPGTIGWSSFRRIELRPPTSRSGTLSHTIAATHDEVLIYGPGKIYLSASSVTPVTPTDPANDAQAMVSLLPINAEYPVIVDTILYHKPFRRSNRSRDPLYYWTLEDPS